MWVLFRRICAPIFMQPPINLSKPWINLSRQQTQILLLIGFLLWTSFLVIETVNVQHPQTSVISLKKKPLDPCSSPTPADDCPEKIVDHSKSRKEVKPPKRRKKVEPPELPVAVAVAVGVAVAGIGAIAGAPILVIVGIGIGILSIGSQALAFFK